MFATIQIALENALRLFACESELSFNQETEIEKKWWDYAHEMKCKRFARKNGLMFVDKYEFYDNFDSICRKGIDGSEFKNIYVNGSYFSSTGGERWTRIKDNHEVAYWGNREIKFENCMFENLDFSVDWERIELKRVTFVNCKFDYRNENLPSQSNDVNFIKCKF